MIHDNEWRMPAGPDQSASAGLAGTIDGPGRPLKSCDNSEQAPITAAPPMANGISSQAIDVDGEKIPVKKA